MAELFSVQESLLGATAAQRGQLSRTQMRRTLGCPLNPKPTCARYYCLHFAANISSSCALLKRKGNYISESESCDSSDFDEDKYPPGKGSKVFEPHVVEFPSYAAMEEEKFWTELLAFPWQRGRTERFRRRLEEKYFPKHGLDSMLLPAYRNKNKTPEATSSKSASSSSLSSGGFPDDQVYKKLDYPTIAKALSPAAEGKESFRSQRSRPSSAKKGSTTTVDGESFSFDTSPTIRTIRAPLSGPKGLSVHSSDAIVAEEDINGEGGKAGTFEATEQPIQLLDDQEDGEGGKAGTFEATEKLIQSLHDQEDGEGGKAGTFEATEKPIQLLDDQEDGEGGKAGTFEQLIQLLHDDIDKDLPFKPPILKRGMVPPEQWNVPRGTVVLVDKAKGWTSFSVCEKIRKLVKVKKVGHAGTLDPMATGLLVVCVGPATKLADKYQALYKVYTGTFRLGEATSSYDADSPVNERKPWEHITDAHIQGAKEAFIGEIMQIPPMFSAIKVDGERLYEKARRGEHLDVPARQVTIYEFRIERNKEDRQDLDFYVCCSKGTYVRSLCADFARALKSCAHLTSLRREKIGELCVDDAWTIPELADTYTHLYRKPTPDS